jgi:hypothetical protein
VDVLLARDMNFGDLFNVYVCCLVELDGCNRFRVFLNRGLDNYHE